MSIPTIQKYPYDDAQYTMDFSDTLGRGEKLTEVSSVSIQSGLSRSSTTFSNDKVQLTLSGGQSGTSYTVVVRVLTSFGNRFEGRGEIEVL